MQVAQQPMATSISQQTTGLDCLRYGQSVLRSVIQFVKKNKKTISYLSLCMAEH